MTMKALDISFGANLAVEDPARFRAWCEARLANGDAEALIVCLWTGAGTPPGAGEALRIAREAGLLTAGYCALTARAIKHVQMAFANTSPEWGHLRFVAVDVELPGITHDQIGRAIEAVAMIGQRPMIYTRANYWREHQGDTDLFCAYPLWECYFDGDADLHGAAYQGSPFGGWETPAGKQYIVDVPDAPYEINGVRCDLNAFSWEFIEGEDEMPELTPDIANALDALRGFTHRQEPNNLWHQSEATWAVERVLLAWLGCADDTLILSSIKLQAAARQLQDASHVLDEAFGVGQS